MIAAMPPLDRTHRAPAQALPELSADCHMHVLGPFDRFPLAADRAYNVPAAALEAHERMKREVGLARTVLVQASGYGYDNRALLDALARLGARGRAVAVVAPANVGRTVSPQLDASLHERRAPSVTHCVSMAICADVRYGGPSSGMRAPIDGVAETLLSSRLPAALQAVTSFRRTLPASTSS